MMSAELKKRQISEAFLKKLDKDGKLHKIVEIVKSDTNLDLELRGSEIMIYYRGGRMLTVSQNGTMKSLDKEYHPEKSKIEPPTIDTLREYMTEAKYLMDEHETKSHKFAEKEIQQRVIYENNLSKNAKDTDFFIADMEWQGNKGLGRADLIAITWGRIGHNNREKRKIKMYVIEVKQGANSLVSQNQSNQKGSGLSAHYNDYLKLISDKKYTKEVVLDMLEVLHQKWKLGLVKESRLDEGHFSSSAKEIKEKDCLETEFLCLMANFSPISGRKLNGEIQKIKESGHNAEKVKFICSSFMGYGLYENCIKTISELPYINE